MAGRRQRIRPHATPPVLSHPPLPQAAPQSGRTYEALSAGRTITDKYGRIEHGGLPVKTVIIATDAGSLWSCAALSVVQDTAKIAFRLAF
jgi:hypothetical protein